MCGVILELVREAESKGMPLNENWSTTNKSLNTLIRDMEKVAEFSNQLQEKSVDDVPSEEPRPPSELQ